MEKLLNILLWFKDTLQQPSTMASLAVISQAVGVKVDTGEVQDWLNVSTLVFGGLGVILQEAKK